MKNITPKPVILSRRIGNAFTKAFEKELLLYRESNLELVECKVKAQVYTTLGQFEVWEWFPI